MGAFEVEVFDKSLTRVGWLGAPQVVTCTPRHNLQPTGTLTVDSDHELAAVLSADGARVVMRYQGEQEMSGMVRLVEGTLGSYGSLTFQVEDDWRLLRRLLGWQVPESLIGSQGAREHRSYSGPAETVVKDVVRDNLARLGDRGGIPVTVAPDLGRGGHVSLVQFRMDPLADRLFPLVDQAGVGVTVRQVGAGLVVDCYEPQDWPITLSQEAGTLTEGSWSRRPPTATAVVVQGPGEGVDRVHRYYVDEALEAAWGDVIEVAVDARDIEADAPDFEALMAARGAEALAAGAVKAGLSLRLSETQTFRYGAGGLRVGDRATAEVAPGVTITDVVREATISETAEDGLNATPVLGERSDGDQVLARVVAQVSRAVRELRAGR